MAGPPAAAPSTLPSCPPSTLSSRKGVRVAHLSNSAGFPCLCREEKGKRKGSKGRAEEGKRGLPFLLVPGWDPSLEAAEPSFALTSGRTREALVHTWCVPVVLSPLVVVRGNGTALGIPAGVQAGAPEVACGSSGSPSHRGWRLRTAQIRDMGVVRVKGPTFSPGGILIYK